MCSIISSPRIFFLPVQLSMSLQISMSRAAFLTTQLFFSAQSSHQGSLDECIPRARSNKQDAGDISHEFCRALCHAGIPLHQADGPLGDLFRRKCPAVRTMPSSDQLYRKYLPGVFENDLPAIRHAVKERPNSITVDETPKLRSRSAAARYAFYDDKLPGRRTLIIDLQVLQQCNAASIAMLVQESLEKAGKTSADVAVLCSDSASHIKNFTTTYESPTQYSRLSTSKIPDICLTTLWRVDSKPLRKCIAL